MLPSRLKPPHTIQYGLFPLGLVPLEIGATGTAGILTELGAAIGGAAGTAGIAVGFGAIWGVVGTAGIDNDPVLPEVLGTSLSLGISLGGVVLGVVGAITGAPGVAQGLTTGPQPQEGFLQLQVLILSSRLGRYEAVPQEPQVGAGAQPQDDLGARWAFNLSRRLGLAHPQDEAAAGPQFEHP